MKPCSSFNSVLFLWNPVLVLIVYFSKRLLHNLKSIYPGTTRPLSKSTRTRYTQLQPRELSTPLPLGTISVEYHVYAIFHIASMKSCFGFNSVLFVLKPVLVLTVCVCIKPYSSFTVYCLYFLVLTMYCLY